MSPEPVTKEELRMMLDVQAKATEQMVLVAQRLQEIVTTQNSLLKLQELSHEAHEKIISRLYNGMSNEIKDGVIDGVDALIKACSEKNKIDSDTISSIKKDTGWQKIIFGALTGLIAIAFLVNQIVAHFATHGS